MKKFALGLAVLIGVSMMLSGCFDMIMLNGTWHFETEPVLSSWSEHTLTFEGDNFEWLTTTTILGISTTTGYRGTFSLDQQADPKEIDFTITEQLAGGYWSATDSKLLGIYKFSDGQFWVKTGNSSSRPSTMDGSFYKFEKD